ncbi:MAG: cyclic nucleotide-binding domain-containing protein [Xenococcaceae cyanobacterium]
MKKALLLFGELNDDDLDWIITTGHLEKIPTGTVLITEGKSIDALYILLEGTVSVSIAIQDGSNEIAILGSGEVFGEMSFMDNSLPSASVEALEDSLVLSISRHKLANTLQQDVGFASRFYRAIAIFLSSRLRTILRDIDQRKDNLPSKEINSIVLSEEVLKNIPVAQAKYDWLLRRVKNLIE